jgi:release factor glutamine methyltransferase
MASIYRPSEDSFLLAECVRHYRGKGALEIGVGSGIILEALQDHFEFVAGTDIDLEALRLCKSRSRSAMLVCCDAAFAFSPASKFDLVVTNPPYLPDDIGAFDRTVDGGPKGIEATVRFVLSALPLLAAAGRILVVISSIAETCSFEDLVAREKLTKKVVKEKKLFYETLSAVELSR